MRSKGESKILSTEVQETYKKYYVNCIFDMRV